MQVRVDDEQGRALPDVSLELVTPFQKSTLSRETAPSGEFEFLLLPAGRYRLDVQSTGFGTVRVGPFDVLPGETTRLSITMAADGDQQTATVSSAMEKPNPLQRTWRRTQQTLALPGPFSLWRFVQNQEPSTINHPPDFGGLDNTRLPLLSPEAGSWTATEYRLNGFDVTDSYQPGRPVFFPAVRTVGLIGFRLGPKPASSSAVGAGIRVFSHYPQRRRWHGSLSSLFTSSEFFSGNLSAQARAGGIVRPEQYRWFTRDHAEFGIPLGRRADLVLSGTGQWASQRRPRQPSPQPLDTRTLFGNARGRVLLGEHHQIQAAAVGSRIDRSGFGHPAAVESLVGRRMAPPFQSSSVLKEEDHLDSIQLGWTRSSSPPNSTLAFEIRYGWGSSHLDTYDSLPAGLPPRQAQSRIELLDGSTSGPAPLNNQAVRNRSQLEGLWRSRTLRAAGIRHQLTLGGGWSQSDVRNRLRAPLDFNLILAEGRPSLLVQFNTTLDSRSEIENFSFHIDDRIRLTRWFSVAAGIRGEWAAGSLPAQSSPAGAFRPARSFGEVDSVIDWNTWAPRVSLTFYPPKTRSLVLRASFARYYYPLAGRYLDFANPNSLSGEEYRWNDRNGDSVWQPGETGTLLRRFGGEFAQIDASIERPHSDEFTIGAGGELPFSLRADLRLFRRDDKDRIAALNTGVPFLNGQAFRGREILDPGTDFVAGTFDDQTLTVYEQIPSTFGNDRFLLTNPGLRSFSSGLVAQLSRGGEHYWWRLSFVAEKGLGATNPGNDPWENDPGVVGSLFQGPNTLINASGRIFFDRAFVAKLQTVYETLPRWGGIEIGAVINYFDGRPFGRKLLVSDLAQGPLVVMATPRGSPEGGQRTEFNLTADLRISREFSLPVGKLRSMVEIFNVPNLGNNSVENDLSGPDFAERLPVAIQPPRYFRVGLAYRF